MAKSAFKAAAPSVGSELGAEIQAPGIDLSTASPAELMPHLFEQVAADVSGLQTVHELHRHVDAVITVIEGGDEIDPELKSTFATGVLMADFASCVTSTADGSGVGLGATSRAKDIRASLQANCDRERLETVARGLQTLFPDELVPQARQKDMANGVLASMGHFDRDRVLQGAARFAAGSHYPVSITVAFAKQARNKVA